MSSDEDKSIALAKLLTMVSRSVGTFDHIVNLARDVTTDTELKHILLSSGNGGDILLAKILMAASRDSEAFAAVSKLSRDVTTATERKVVLMSGGGDGITVLAKILISASLDVKAFPVVMKFSREVVSDLEMKEILMSSAGDESTVLDKMLVSASREVGALYDILALSREIITDLEVVGFLAAKDEYGDTCLSYALKNQNLTWFRKLWEIMRSFLSPNQLDALINSPAVVENAKEKEKNLLKGVKESIERRRSQGTCKPCVLSRNREMTVGLGDWNANATWETNNGAQEVQASDCVSKDHQTLKEETLAHSLRAGPKLFRSEVYGVELELQEGSLEQDVNGAVTISPQLRFVVCQTVYHCRTLSEEFLAMPFINGPEGVKFREDKPALLRFYLGLVEDILSVDVTDTKSVDEAIKKTVREWYTPLSSPDGKGDWVSLGPYAVTYRHEGENQEVWVETPLRHFSKVANGVKINIPGYKHKEHARDHYYYGEISWLPRRMRSRTANLKVRFGNATQSFATFTSRPIFETTEKSEEAETRTKASTGLMEGTFGWHRQSNVRGRHLPAFTNSTTTVVASGQFEDFEMPCDIEIHKQMRVRVGVLQNLTSSEPDAKGKLQLLDERPISGNMILVLRQPRLEAPSEFGKLSWPKEKDKIFQV